MDIKSYLAILNGNKWLILAALIAAVAATTVITFMTSPTYTTSTTLRIATAASGVVGYSDYMYADRLMNTYTKIATSGPVLRELAGKLKLQKLPQVQIETIPNTELIKVTVESSDPAIAQHSADILADILITEGKDFYSGGGKSAQDILSEQLKQAEDELNQVRQDYEKVTSKNPDDSPQVTALNKEIQLKEKTYATLLDQYDQARLREAIRANIISIVEPAPLPVEPSKPNKPLNILLSAMIGLAGGVGLAFFFESFNSHLYTTRQIEAAADIHAIGKIPLMPGKLSWVRNTSERNRSAAFKEAFSQLQVNLSRISLDKLDGKPLKTLLITSSEPGEGKSTIVANLAIAAAQSGKRVIVVDCDFHRPRQHKINGLPNELGLSSVIGGEANAENAVQLTQYPGLQVLTSGPLPANSAKVLASPQMGDLIKQLTQRYDLVLLDTPALLTIADAALLSALADGVALVVRRNLIQADSIQEACQQLVDIQARVIGLIVNHAEMRCAYYSDQNT